MKAMLNDYFFLSGTILPWVPKPSKGTINPVVIPKCWVECNGKQIPSGIWRGQKTPHLSGYLRHRGGVHISGSESFSTLESCMHGMGIDDESNFDEMLHTSVDCTIPGGNVEISRRDKRTYTRDKYRYDTRTGIRHYYHSKPIKGVNVTEKTFKMGYLKVAYIVKVC